jgi:DNA-directed RNA polymerase omega subunit
MYRIPERIDSTFRYVLLAARRAEQLMRGGRPKIEVPQTKPSRIALAEVSQDVLEWDYGPAPEPELPDAEMLPEEETA